MPYLKKICNEWLERLTEKYYESSEAFMLVAICLVQQMSGSMPATERGNGGCSESLRVLGTAAQNCTGVRN